MQNSKEVKHHGQFGWLYKVLCQEKCVKPLPAVQAYLSEGCLRFCVDRVALKSWSPILRSIAENRSLSRIYVYSRSKCKRVWEKLNTEEKLEKLWRCKGKDRKRPVIYTNFLLRCLVDSIAVCVRDSPAITSITLDGIPLSSKYLNILCCGLKNNEKLAHLSLVRCRIGDVGCDMLLGSLRNNPRLRSLNLSSCRLTNRSAVCLSLFLKRRKADVLQNVWERSSAQSHEENSGKKPQGLQTLILNQNQKFGDTGVRHLSYALKSDVWLKSLSLRHCGLTKHGAEIMIRVLQRDSSAITKLDLTENHIPINALQRVLKTLKRRREMLENAALKKRFRKDCGTDMKNVIREPFKQDRKNIRNRIERPKKYSFRKRHWRRMHRYERRIKHTKELQTTKNDDYYGTVYCGNRKLCDLELQLLKLIESNLRLKGQLSSNKAMLDSEAQQRIKIEDELQKVSLRLNDLKGKVVMLNCVSTKAYNESQLMKALKDIFEKLESLSTTAKQEDQKETDVVLNVVEPLWSAPTAQQNGHGDMSSCLQRRQYCATLNM